MRPFREGGGYWLYVPKPWNGRKCYGIPNGIDKAKKSIRLFDIIEKLQSSKKKHKHRRQVRINYGDGQSLFLLPKTLSKGIHHWNSYESRFKEWMEKISKSVSHNASADLSSAFERDSSSINELSLLNHSFEDDPLRGFYTIWNMNTTRIPKTKLSTSEKVFEHIHGVWKSREVDQLLCKTPKGGVSGRIEDPSLLSAKGRDTLQRWSRVVTHYDEGNVSGEDEDPVEMFNRAIETSMLNDSAGSSGTPADVVGSSRKRKHDSSGSSLDCDVTEPPLAASTAIRPKSKASRLSGSAAENSQLVKKSVNDQDEAHINDNSSQSKSYETSSSPPTSSENRSKVQNEQFSAQKSLHTPSTKIPLENRRRSPRVNIMKSLENSPKGKDADTKERTQSGRYAIAASSERKGLIRSPEDHDENLSDQSASPLRNSTSAGMSTGLQNKKSPPNSKTSKAQPSPLRQAKDAKTPLTRRSVSSSLRRRALINSAIRSSGSAEKLSSTPVRGAGSSNSRDPSDCAAETPKTGKVTEKDKTTSASPSRTELLRKKAPKNVSSPTKRASPASKVSCEQRKSPRISSASGGKSSSERQK